MRVRVPLAFALLLIAADEPSKPEAQARAFLDKYHAAYTKPDPDALKTLIADDAVITSITGELDTREKLAAMLRGDNFKVKDLETTEFKARPLGPDAVLTTYRVQAKVQANGQDLNLPLRYTTVIAKKGNDWQVVASHSSVIAAEAQ